MLEEIGIFPLVILALIGLYLVYTENINYFYLKYLLVATVLLLLSDWFGII